MSSIPMSETGARIRASLLGLCMVIVGGCMLAVMGDGFGFWAVIDLVIAMVVSFYKLTMICMGVIFVLVGVIWMVKPHRALDTIDRNKK